MAGDSYNLMVNHYDHNSVSVVINNNNNNCKLIDKEQD